MKYKYIIIIIYKIKFSKSKIFHLIFPNLKNNKKK